MPSPLLMPSVLSLRTYRWSTRTEPPGLWNFLRPGRSVTRSPPSHRGPCARRPPGTPIRHRSKVRFLSGESQPISSRVARSRPSRESPAAEVASWLRPGEPRLDLGGDDLAHGVAGKGSDQPALGH